MKKTILSIILLATMASTISSCFVSQDRHGRRTDRGRRYPHDDHHYNNYNH